MADLQIQVQINGAAKTLNACSLAELVQSAAPTQKQVAVALNSQVVHAQDWSNTPVKDGDQIEIVTPFAGG